MRVVAAAGILLLALTSCRTLPSGRPVGGLGDATATATHFAFYPESAAKDATVVRLPESGVAVRIAATPVVRAQDVVRIDVVPAELGKSLVFQVTPPAAEELARLKPEDLRVVLVVNGTAFASRRVDDTLRAGSLNVFPEVPESNFTRFADELRSGLTAPDRDALKATR